VIEACAWIVGSSVLGVALLAVGARVAVELADVNLFQP